MNTQEELLNMSNEYPIEGAIFNLIPSVPEDDYYDSDAELISLSVVLSAEKIVCSLQSDLITPLRNRDWGRSIHN